MLTLKSGRAGVVMALIITIACAPAFATLSPARAQSGEMTIDQCIENLLTPEPKDTAVHDKLKENPQQNPGRLKVPSVDTNNDNVISRREAEVACGAGKTRNDAATTRSK